MRVGLRCDAGAVTGVGHLARCVALAEELALRGGLPIFLGTVNGVAWAGRQLASRGFPIFPAGNSAPQLVELARQHRLDAIVLDSYHLDTDCAGALRSSGVVTVGIIDGDARAQECDIYVDQNFGADLAPAPPAGRLLAGARFALLRSAVVAARPSSPPPARAVACPNVVAFFGGTDAFGAAPVLARLLLATGKPVELTVVVGRPELEAQLRSLAMTGEQSMRLIAPTDDLPALVGSADLVISAAGTSTWELCCLGAASALVAVADNQQASYNRVVANGIAAGLGRLAELARAGSTAGNRAAGTLRRLLTVPARRAELSARAWGTVDGLGRGRVVDAVVAQLSMARPVPETGAVHETDARAGTQSTSPR